MSQIEDNHLPFVESVCSCDQCKSMCTVPCIPTPAEAVNLLSKGYASQLRKRTIHLLASYDQDFEYRESTDIDVICPASKRPDFVSSGCVFQDDTGLCTLHDAGLKPLEGRLAYCGMLAPDYRKPAVSLHEYVVCMWNTDEGRQVVERFMRSEVSP